MKPTVLACFFCPWYSETRLNCILEEYDPKKRIPKECPKFDEGGR